MYCTKQVLYQKILLLITLNSNVEKMWHIQKNDIIIAIMGFIDLKASDMNILELLQKHYDIYSVYE